MCAVEAPWARSLLHSCILALGFALVGCSAPGEPADAQRPCLPAHAARAPALTGPYCVGVATHRLVDAERTDPFTGSDGAREVSLTMHFPIERGSIQPPAPHGEVETWGVHYGEARSVGMVSQAVVGEDVATTEEGFPLVLYSPGFAQGLADANTFLIADLVSHGYVVAAIDHPFVSHATRLLDGSVARFGDGARVVPMPDPSDLDAVYAFPTVVGDVLFVLDVIRDIQASDPMWKGRLDLTRLGMFGHSYGGAIAAELLRRGVVDAAVNYDGRYHADVLEHGAPGPLMLVAIDGRITADAPPNDDYGYREVTATADPGYFVEVAGAVHGMFQADIGVLLKAKRGRNDRAFSGEVDADLNLEICARYNLAFFDRHLRGAPDAALEDLGRRYDVVTFGVVP